MSETPVTLGVDLGTSGVKVVALDDAGRLVAEAGRSYPLLTPGRAGPSSVHRTGWRAPWRRCES